MHLFVSHSKMYKMLNICNKKIAYFFTYRYSYVSEKNIYGVFNAFKSDLAMLFLGCSKVKFYIKHEKPVTCQLLNMHYLFKSVQAQLEKKVDGSWIIWKHFCLCTVTISMIQNTVEILFVFYKCHISPETKHRLLLGLLLSVGK